MDEVNGHFDPWLMGLDEQGIQLIIAEKEIWQELCKAKERRIVNLEYEIDRKIFEVENLRKDVYNLFENVRKAHKEITLKEDEIKNLKDSFEKEYIELGNSNKRIRMDQDNKREREIQENKKELERRNELLEMELKDVRERWGEDRKLIDKLKLNMGKMEDIVIKQDKGLKAVNKDSICIKKEKIDESKEEMIEKIDIKIKKFELMGKKEDEINKLLAKRFDEINKDNEGNDIPKEDDNWGTEVKIKVEDIILEEGDIINLIKKNRNQETKIEELSIGHMEKDKLVYDMKGAMLIMSESIDKIGCLYEKYDVTENICQLKIED